MNGIFVECFGEMEEPRMERTRKHGLIDIIALSMCGVLAGSESFVEIEDFGKTHEKWLKQFLCLENGIPSHDTLRRVFSLLAPKELQKNSLKWLQKVRELFPETVIPIDGKTLRGSKNGFKKAFHTVSAWSCANGVSLGQLKVNDKSNEITAVPEILKQLYLKGAIITLDAMGCQETIVNQIVEAEADYVLALKGNQGELHETVRDTFHLLDKGLSSPSLKIHTAQIEPEKHHGRIEKREIQTIDTAALKDFISPRWTALHSIIRIICHRNDVREERFYISSLPADNPQKILHAVRSHWEIENNLHWVLDVVFREDDCLIRDENAALNFAWLRKLSLGLLKNTEHKVGIRRKQRKILAQPSLLLKFFNPI